jgi:hypothetical protein
MRYEFASLLCSSTYLQGRICSSTKGMFSTYQKISILSTNKRIDPISSPLFLILNPVFSFMFLVKPFPFKTRRNIWFGSLTKILFVTLKRLSENVHWQFRVGGCVPKKKWIQSILFFLPLWDSLSIFFQLSLALQTWRKKKKLVSEQNTNKPPNKRWFRSLVLLLIDQSSISVQVHRYSRYVHFPRIGMLSDDISIILDRHALSGISFAANLTFDRWLILLSEDKWPRTQTRNLANNKSKVVKS